MKHKNFLPPEKLGILGEKAFEKLCASAGVACNDSHIDRTGWDYIVEIEDESETTKSFDLTSPTKKFLVQVKAVGQRTPVVKLGLNAARLLCQTEWPALIYVVKLDDLQNEIESFFIHLIDEPLVKILKRLRKESASGVDKIDPKKEISFSINKYKNGNFIDRNNIYSTLNDFSSDSKEYIDRKNHQRLQEGFDSITHYVTFQHDDLLDTKTLTDFWLGEVSHVPSKIETTEIRFGIPLTKNNYFESLPSLSVVPEEEEGHSLRIKNTTLDIDEVVLGTFTRTPMATLVASIGGSKFESKFIKIIFYILHNEIYLTLSPALEEMSAKEWLRYVSVRACLFHKNTESTLSSPDGDNLYIPDMILTEGVDDYPDLISILKALTAIEEKAKVYPKKYTIEELVRAKSDNYQTLQLMAFELPSYAIKITSDEILEIGGSYSELNGLFISLSAFGEKIFAFALFYKGGKILPESALAFTSDKGILLSSTFIGKRGLPFAEVHEKYTQFASEVSDRVEGTIVYVQPFVENINKAKKTVSL